MTANEGAPKVEPVGPDPDQEPPRPAPDTSWLTYSTQRGRRAEPAPVDQPEPDG